MLAPEPEPQVNSEALNAEQEPVVKDWGLRASPSDMN
jgi:hypothetical protein